MYKDQGFQSITMLDSGTPQAWASMHSLTHPVMEVATNLATKYWSNFVGYPSGKMVKPMMVVNVADVHPASVNDSMIQAILP